MNLPHLHQTLKDLKEPNFRFEQAKRAYFVDFLGSWEEVSTFSKPLRTALAEQVPWTSMKEVKTQASANGDTVKTLFECADGKKIETVLMRADDGRNTVCVSCQVGCPMACAFCATGTMGLKRQLTADEIVDQVMHFARWLKPKGGTITNIVYMGMGEPMHNYEVVMQSIDILHDPKGFNLGARHFTISTCGVVPGILKLAEQPLQINLAISLHSAINVTRSKIMPVNNLYPVEKLMQAVDTYAEKSNRKVFFEYLLIDGLNDTREEADALAKLLEHNFRLYHVNLIKYHDTDAFTGTPKESRVKFMQRLQELGVPVTHRITFGEDIDAACGQLAVNDAKGTVEQGKVAIRKNREDKAAAIAARV